MGSTLKSNYDLVLDLIKRYPNAFNENEISSLLNYAKRDHKPNTMIPDLIREVYYELGILRDEENIYLGFMDLLSNNFDYQDRNIIEVGGGIFPRLAKRISNEQITGKIKVYDPRLNSRERSSDKFKVARYKFYADENIGDTNLLLGFMPCEATYNIIDAASRNNVDFMIALCEGGPHGDIYDYFENDNEWLDTMIYMAERAVEDNNMGTIKKDYLKEYHNPYPIIYNKR